MSKQYQEIKQKEIKVLAKIIKYSSQAVIHDNQYTWYHKVTISFMDPCIKYERTIDASYLKF